MKALKMLGGVLFALLLLFVVLGLIAPKEFHVERSTTINAAATDIFPHVKHFAQQKDWSPWARRDPALEQKLEGTDGTVGAKMSWDTEKSGAGQQVVTEIVENETMKTDLTFTKPFESASKTFINLKENGDATDVTWGFYGTHGFVESIFMYFMDLDASVGKDYAEGLGFLKEIVEEEVKNKPQLTVQEIELPQQYFVAVREEVAMDKISEHYAQNLPKIAETLANKNIEMAGMPCGVFYSWDEEKGTTDLAQSIPVSKILDIDGYTSLEVAGGKALLIDFYGDYAKTIEAHNAIDKYLKDNNLSFRYPVIEQYVTDPTEEPDPNKWLTKVMYFIES